MKEIPVRQLKGIGPKTAEQLSEMGLGSVNRLVRFYPADYECMEDTLPLKEAVPGQIQAFRAFVDTLPQAHGFGRNAVISFRIRDDSGTLRVSYFHMPYIKSRFRKGEELIFRGSVRDGGKYGLSLDQPKIYSPEEYALQLGIIRPVYALPHGISPARFSQAMRQALALCEAPDLLPPRFLPEGSPDSLSALRQIHFPQSRKELEAARARLILEEFACFILRVRLLRREESGGNPCPMNKSGLADSTAHALPYRLTGAQERAYEDIRRDVAGDRRMNRLLQGDVGSGKTAVALLAMLLAVGNGFQAALMAPTEVLAEQHYRKLSGLLADSPVRITLLTGSVRSAKRQEALKAIASGETDIVIGTHALIQEKVEYARLGLVITDEQHRFGVRQRGILAEKGREPHMLVMSATPIPRTLAIILYGDLDVSVLDELPGGRIPVQNAVVSPAARKSAYRLIEREARAGRRAYIICPLVEESEGIGGENVEDYSRRLKEILPADITVGTLHGRMKADEKNAVMRDFAEGKIQVLVSTTVVEVGVDVPEATVMMVENAERFGLAQLHQLRGRVGRGSDPSYAIFVDGSGKKEKNRRLAIMARENDGFKIAEEDLRLRGPGDLFGVRQSGEMRFKLGDIYSDHGLLMKAAGIAGAILEEDPQLKAPEYGALKENMLQYDPEDQSL